MQSAREPIKRLLERARRELGLDVVFVNELADGMQIHRYVEGGHDERFCVGATVPADETYCARVLDGRLPNVLSDAQADPRVRDMAATKEANVGSYIGVPLVLPSGRVFGTLCAVGAGPRPDLSEREVAFLRLIADLIADEVDEAVRLDESRRDAQELVADILRRRRYHVVLQPIVAMAERRPVGFEPLTRFDIEVPLPPDRVFSEAWACGRGHELEAAVVRRALELLPRLPEDVYLSINASPQAILVGDVLEEVRASGAPHRLVVEMTEHMAVEDYPIFQAAVRKLMDLGVRLAVDDTGAGYSSLSHVLNLAPEIIKLDVSMVREIHADIPRQAMMRALLAFATETNSSLVAEGVESELDASVIQGLGVRFGQGFLFQRPAAVETLEAKGWLAPAG